MQTQKKFAFMIKLIYYIYEQLTKAYIQYIGAAMNTRVIIIGAGASGLACAIKLKQNNKNTDVCILERLEYPGKKILATGNGRCNITNTAAEHYREVKSFFESLGLMLKELEEGRVYPYSLKAETALSILLDECKKQDIKIITDCTAQFVVKTENGFLIKTSKGDLKADFVVAAAGGKAQSALGSDGSGYTLLKPFGHSITPLSPALVQLTSSSKYPRAIKGTRTRCGIKILINGREEASEYGEVLFTDYGLSGIAVMNVSAAVSKAFAGGEKPKCLAVLDLIPELTEKEALEHIKKFGNLKGILGTKLDAITEKQSGGDHELQARAVKGWRLIITGTKGYDYAQITCGGIPMSEVEDFESKKTKGLYICGELLDRQFKCGGFNLDFAWHSGIAAADKIAKECIQKYDKDK